MRKFTAVAQISMIAALLPQKSTSKFLLSLLGFAFLGHPLNAQSDNRFYAGTYSQAVFAQIDGDQASGYNKLGYGIGGITGYAWSTTKIKAIEFHLGIAERGSRRAPSIEDPTITPFHIRYQTFEAALGVVLPLKFLPLTTPVDFFTGIRPYRLFRVEDTEMYMPSIDQDMRSFGALLELQLRFPIRENWLLAFTGNYGAVSISKGSANSSMYYPMGNGAYHNNISVGLIYKPNNRK